MGVDAKTALRGRCRGQSPKARPSLRVDQATPARGALHGPSGHRPREERPPCSAERSTGDDDAGRAQAVADAQTTAAQRLHASKVAGRDRGPSRRPTRTTFAPSARRAATFGGGLGLEGNRGTHGGNEKVAVVGATGAVGREILRTPEGGAAFPVGHLHRAAREPRAARGRRYGSRGVTCGSTRARAGPARRGSVRALQRRGVGLTRVRPHRRERRRHRHRQLERMAQ